LTCPDICHRKIKNLSILRATSYCNIGYGTVEQNTKENNLWLMQLNQLLMQQVYISHT
jgi:hypothetical protein